jgi:DGQHR domain-containing protein
VTSNYESPVVLTSTLTGQPLAVGVISAGALVDRYVIPRRDSRSKTGYQREVSTARVNRLMKDLRTRRVDLPTSVLVNLRTFDESTHLVRSGESVKLVIQTEDRLNIVDGQHRVEALVRLVDEDHDKWADVQLPFVCMLGGSEREEIKQFYVVNSTAKSVRTDLAFDLLKQRAESDPLVMEALIESGETWKVRGQQLAEDLEKASAQWRGRVRFPGDAAGATTIGSSGLVNSFKGLLQTPYFGSITQTNQVAILAAYWAGIAQVIPEAFEDPGDYAVQKSVGVQILNGLLVPVLEYVRSTGESVLEPDSYAKALTDALTMIEGDTGNGEVARGGEFWLAGRDGAAGSYSSNAGRRVLTAELRNLLPNIEVE